MSITYTSAPAHEMQRRGFVRFVCPNNMPWCDGNAWVDRETIETPLKERDKHSRECNACGVRRQRRAREAAHKALATKRERGTDFQCFPAYTLKLPTWLEYVSPCKRHADCKADIVAHPPPDVPKLAIRCARAEPNHKVGVLVKRFVRAPFGTLDMGVHDPRRVRVVVVTGTRTSKPEPLTWPMLKAEGRVLLAPLAITLVRVVVCPEDKIDEFWTAKYGAAAE